MRGFVVTVQRCFLESPGDYLEPVGWPCFALYDEDFGHIWTLTGKKKKKANAALNLLLFCRELWD